MYWPISASVLDFFRPHQLVVLNMTHEEYRKIINLTYSWPHISSKYFQGSHIFHMYLYPHFLFTTSVIPSLAASPIQHAWSPHYAKAIRMPVSKKKKVLFPHVPSALSEMSLISTTELLIIQSLQQKSSFKSSSNLSPSSECLIWGDLDLDPWPLSGLLTSLPDMLHLSEF